MTIAYCHMDSSEWNLTLGWFKEQSIYFITFKISIMRINLPKLNFVCKSAWRHCFVLVFFSIFFGGLQAQTDWTGYTYVGSLNGHSYYLSNSGLNGAPAHAAAEAQCGYLASITSEEENTFVFNNTAGAWWVLIGLSDVAVEGTFVWHSGEPLSYTNWHPSEPNNAGNEDWVHLHRYPAGQWNDVNDSYGPQRYVVEIEDNDNDGTADACDPDDDNDGLPDYCDLLELISNIAWDANDPYIHPSWKCGNNNKKVKLCHVPPGNPANAHTICISPSAVQAHLNHGDYLGDCTCNGEEGFVAPGNNDHAIASGKQLELEVFPNPAKNMVNIHLHGMEGEASLTIFDLMGRTVWVQQVEEGELVLQVDLTDVAFQNGIYLVSVISQGERMTKRLVITK